MAVVNIDEKKPVSKHARPFFGGVTTDPELKRLLDAHPLNELKHGQVFTHSEIEEIVGCEWRTTRYTGITNRWRKQAMREYGLIINCLVGVGFKVLDDNEKVKASDDKLGTAIKIARTSQKIAATVDRKKLDEDVLKKHDHQQLVYAKMEAVNQMKRALPMPEM